ncbi:enolase C-terminal domain-like protein [Microlunatus sp. GCM10028923]|uniref:enolase C-terminal domain-like protein n=1 Tax=Microlunatus sp. GCM10028923 TaxID=3273400 RepID=UPI00360BC562
MIIPEVTVSTVRTARLRTRYPRPVGRNARLGHHGDGGESAVAIIEASDGSVGWGLFEGDSGPIESVVDRPVAELIDPATGITDPSLHWLDIALHDLAGVLLDLPVYAMLGGSGSTRVEVYDGAIYFDDLDPDDAPRGVAAALRNCADDAATGHRSFKLKIGRGNRWLPREAGDRRDREVTRAVREAYPEARILVDANDGYDLAGFVEYAEAVADCDLYWVEEPFADDAADLAGLRQALDRISPDTKIADGEFQPELDQLLPIAGAGDLNVLLMDVISFGLTRWRAIMPELIKLGVAASPHAWGRPLKTLYAAQFAAGLGNIDIVEGVPGTTDGVDTGSYRFADGHLSVPDRPGFGLPVPDVP